MKEALSFENKLPTKLTLSMTDNLEKEVIIFYNG